MVELTDLDGVGPARSDSMEAAGYDTVESLAEAGAETLAEEIGVPDDTALEFVVQAQNIVEEESSSESAQDDADDDESEDGPMPADLAEDDESESSDESEQSDDDDEAEPEYLVPIKLPSDTHYDAYFTALLHAYERRVGSHEPSEKALQHALDDARYEDQKVEHSLTEYEINTIHAAVKQQATDYKGDNMIEYMDALNEVLENLNDVRSEKLF